MADSLSMMNPAEAASARALAQVYECLDRGVSFRLEAGAGAGKTYTLVKALQYLIERDRYALPKRHQQIACITFTNVAKDEIESRTDRSPLVYCGTIHAFCWSLIDRFQKQMRDRLAQMEPWPEKIAESGELGEKPVEYTLGHRSIRDDHISLHHDDVLELTVHFMESVKFRVLFRSTYPVVLIDEYQDTNAKWIDSIKNRCLGTTVSPLFGLFGDHWQKVYGDGCGRAEHAALEVIGKEANFRSVTAIVDCLNRMRPELPQFVVDPADRGSVFVFHTNDWAGVRQKGQHWAGDLPATEADAALQLVIDALNGEGWNLAPTHTKILMLTHRSLAAKQGYGSLPSVFAFNGSFAKKEDVHIAFFADTLEPACDAFSKHRYGAMFQILGGHHPLVRGHADKEKWATSMRGVLGLRGTGTVGQVVDYLRRTHMPRLPDAVERRERLLEQFDGAAGEAMPRALSELKALHNVPYKEVIALCHYLAGHSPFETKHGVKGAEFENVLVVVGRGWNQYNFNEMLEFAQSVDRIPVNRQDAFERNRNLFYVACSRPKRRLAILFTQKLSEQALRTVCDWFGADAIRPLAL